MITLDTFLQIRHEFHNEHRPIPQIARHLDLDTKTVAKWAHQPEYTPGKPRHRQSKLDSFKPTILKLLHEQGLSASRIYGLLRDAGYRGGYTILRSFVSHQRFRVPLTPKEFHSQGWMHRLMQDNIPLLELQEEFAGKIKPDELSLLTRHIKTGVLRVRNKAVAIFAFNKSIAIRLISRFLLQDIKTVSKWRKEFRFLPRIYGYVSLENLRC